MCGRHTLLTVTKTTRTRPPRPWRQTVPALLVGLLLVPAVKMLAMTTVATIRGVRMGSAAAVAPAKAPDADVSAVGRGRAAPEGEPGGKPGGERGVQHNKLTAARQGPTLLRTRGTRPMPMSADHSRNGDKRSNRGRGYPMLLPLLPLPPLANTGHLHVASAERAAMQARTLASKRKHPRLPLRMRHRQTVQTQPRQGHPRSRAAPVAKRRERVKEEEEEWT